VKIGQHYTVIFTPLFVFIVYNQHLIIERLNRCSVMLILQLLTRLREVLSIGYVNMAPTG